MTNPSQDPSASSRVPNQECFQEQWPYKNQYQDAKTQSGTYILLQSSKSWLKRHDVLIWSCSVCLSVYLLPYFHTKLSYNCHIFSSGWGIFMNFWGDFPQMFVLVLKKYTFIVCLSYSWWTSLQKFLNIYTMLTMDEISFWISLETFLGCFYAGSKLIHICCMSACCLYSILKIDYHCESYILGWSIVLECLYTSSKQ